MSELDGVNYGFGLDGGSKALAAGEFYVPIGVLFCDAERVGIIRVIGMCGFQEIFEAWRKKCEANPARVNWPIIYDVRTWVGIMTDTDISLAIANTDAFRQRHNLAPGTRPPFAYLVTRNAGSEFIAKQMQDVRGAETMVAYSAQEAWQLIAPDTPMPKRALSFFR